MQLLNDSLGQIFKVKYLLEDLDLELLPWIFVLEGVFSQSFLNLGITEAEVIEVLETQRANCALILDPYWGSPFSLKKQGNFPKEIARSQVSYKYLFLELVPHKNFAVALGEEVHVGGFVSLLDDEFFWHELQNLNVLYDELNCVRQPFYDIHPA